MQENTTAKEEERIVGDRRTARKMEKRKTSTNTPGRNTQRDDKSVQGR